jgi:hypothetical protein
MADKADHGYSDKGYSDTFGGNFGKADRFGAGEDTFVDRLTQDLKTDFKNTFNLKNLGGLLGEYGLQNLMSSSPQTYAYLTLARGLGSGLQALGNKFGFDVSPGEMTQEDMDKAAKQERPIFNEPSQPGFSYEDPLLMQRYQAYLQAGYPPEMADYLVNTLT